MRFPGAGGGVGVSGVMTRRGLSFMHRKPKSIRIKERRGKGRGNPRPRAKAIVFGIIDRPEDHDVAFSR